MDGQSGFIMERKKTEGVILGLPHSEGINTGVPFAYQGKVWYFGTIDGDKFTEDMLNEYETANVMLIQKYQDRRRVRTSGKRKWSVV